MVLNCLSEVFSFNCRRKKKKSNVFRKNKEESESDTLSNCTMVSKNEKVKKKEEDSDIIDSYSKSNESKVKIKKSIQVNKSQLGKKSKQEPESPEPIPSSYSEYSEEVVKNKKSRPKDNKKDLVLKDINKDKNTGKNDFKSTVDDLSNSLKKLNASRKKHQLIKLNDRVKDTNNTKKSEVEHRNLKGKYVSEEMESPPLSQSISNDSEQRNFLSDVDVQRTTRKASKVIDSDSEIWFLKNKHENLKFNHNLRMKMVEYLIKKSSK